MSSPINTPDVCESIINEIIQTDESIVDKLVDDFIADIEQEFTEKAGEKRQFQDVAEPSPKRRKVTKYTFADDVTEDESSDEEEIDEDPTESDLEFIASDSDEDDDAASYVAPEDEDLENIPPPTRRLRGRCPVNYIESEDDSSDEE